MAAAGGEWHGHCFEWLCLPLLPTLQSFRWILVQSRRKIDLRPLPTHRPSSPETPAKNHPTPKSPPHSTRPRPSARSPQTPRSPHPATGIPRSHPVHHWSPPRRVASPQTRAMATALSGYASSPQTPDSTCPPESVHPPAAHDLIRTPQRELSAPTTCPSARFRDPLRTCSPMWKDSSGCYRPWLLHRHPCRRPHRLWLLHHHPSQHRRLPYS